MVADRGSLLIRWARLRDGRVCDITVESGRIAAITPNDPDQRDRKGGPARGPVIEASGRLVTESFINGHQHLDKVYTRPGLGTRRSARTPAGR